MKPLFNRMPWTVPNVLTLTRVLSVPPLWALAMFDYRLTFTVIFALSWLTDALDGYFARKLNQCTDFGAWFDSFADNLLIVSMPFWIALLRPGFVLQYKWALLGLVVLFFLSLAIGYIKYHVMVHYHLWSSKIAAIMLALFFVYILLFEPHPWLVHATFIVFGLELLEEILVTLNSKKMSPNKKSLFSPR